MTDVPERLSETFAALAKAATPGADFDKSTQLTNLALFCSEHREAIAEALAMFAFIAWCGSHRAEIAEALALREDPRTARARRLLEMVECNAFHSALWAAHHKAGDNFDPHSLMAAILARLDESEGTHE